MNRHKRVANLLVKDGPEQPLGLAVGEAPQIAFRFCAHCQATADSLEDLKPDYCRHRDQPELPEGRHAIVKPDLLCDLALSIRSTVIPVKCILRPVAAGKVPMRRSLKMGPVCVPPPSQRPTT